jgi:glucokinase
MAARSPELPVVTLDAGGTNFTFSAIHQLREVVPPFTLPARGDDLEACLAQLVTGFERTLAALDGPAAAISFAFPGPADYKSGIIGDLANLPGFRGGVPLGPLLEDRFGLPVFINNDGDLFAYGEASFGFLPEVNRWLAASGSPKRYQNLLGITLGTGFGGGIVSGGRLLRGDNSAAGEIWLQRNKLDRRSFAEEGVSIRAVRRAYAEAAGITATEAPDPQHIAAIADGREAGNGEAARQAFQRLGEVTGDAVANALTLVDGLLVIGGGLAGASRLFLPALVAELNSRFATVSGEPVPRLEMVAFNLEDAGERERFLGYRAQPLRVPGSDRTVLYDGMKRTGAGVSRLGTSRAIALGAYAYAQEQTAGAAGAGRE